MLSRRFALAATLFLAAAVVAAAPAAAQEASDTGERSITVAGDGFLFADNDIATFRLGVTTRRRSAGRALRANSRTMRRITAAVRARRVATGDIETDVVSLDRVSLRGRATYVARNAVSVTIRDLERAGEIVDAAVRAGATNVYGPQFGLANRALVYRDALALAFADARTKAERLAREAGVTLGPVLRIRESGLDDFDEGGGGRLEAGAPARGEPPISPGRTRVSAGVVVTFATS
jgi:uncharacterized protein YggE